MKTAKMKFSSPEPITRAELKDRLAAEDVNVSAEALIRMSLWETDWEWAETVCLTALNSDKKEVRTAALIALGHLARRFRDLHLDLVILAISKLLDDPDYQGAAEDALDDIAVFSRRQHVH